MTSPWLGAATGSSAVRCRLLGSDRQITLRSTLPWELVPGDIITVEPRKRWTHARHPYMSGEIVAWRFAPREIGLVPLRLEPKPSQDSRPAFEMEDVPDGADGAILEAIGACEARDFEHARQVVAELLARDLRCLAARWLLARISFRGLPAEALRGYESGVRIGDLSLSPDFRGVLPWSWPGNRPFLRCLLAYGLCLWRLERFDEARSALHRLLGLDPGDHQGVRAAFGAVERRQPWEETGPGLAEG